MLFSLSPNSKLHKRDDEKRDRERDGVVWGGDDILQLVHCGTGCPQVFLFLIRNCF